MLTYEGRNNWMAEELLEKRMWVDVNDYHALYSCVENGAVNVAKLLLDNGTDFGRYRQIYPNSGSPEVIQALEEHWAGLQAQAQEQGQDQGEGQAPAKSGAPIEAQRSGFDGERRSGGVSELSPLAEAKDTQHATPSPSLPRPRRLPPPTWACIDSKLNVKIPAVHRLRGFFLSII